MHCALFVAMASFLSAFLDTEEDYDMDEAEAARPTAMEEGIAPVHVGGAVRGDCGPSTHQVSFQSAARTPAVQTQEAKKAVGKPPKPASQAHEAPDKKRGKDTQKRAPRGSKDTFAGRRPPNDPAKLEIFCRMREDYFRIRKTLSEQGPKKGKKKATATVSQEAYWKHMQKAMAEVKGTATERFTLASKSFCKDCGVN